MNFIEIGREIKKQRLMQHLSLEQLAKETSINKATLSRYENGKTKNISLENFIAIARTLGIDFNDFDEKKGKFEHKETDAVVSKILKSVEKLTSDRRGKVLKFVKSQLATQKTLNMKKAYATILADGVLSAGSGEFLDTNSERFAVKVPEPVPSKYDYAFKINGHSMEPLYQDGQVIFLQQDESYRSGQVVAAIVNGSAFLKRIQVDKDHINLMSLNPDYPDVKVAGDDSYRILGRIFS